MATGSAAAIRPLSELLAARPNAVPGEVRSRISGQPVAGDGGELPMVYPATGEVFGALRCADRSLVDEAVAAARETFQRGVWRKLAAGERQAVFRRVAETVRAHAQELAFLETLCAGLPVSHLQRRQVPRAAENFDFFADVIGTLAGESYEQLDGYLTLVTREPVGVAALLSPWNAPLALTSMQIASCVALGNSCVVKPSEHTPLSIARLVELIEEAGVPPGVVNLVNGPGPEAGAVLVEHAGVDRIAFTGGTATARGIMAAAARNLTPVHFELGGKSANMVFDDADLARAVDGSLLSIFSNNGQICIAGSRILVQRGVAEEFTARFVERARRLRVGDPMDPEVEIGPLAFEAHRRRVLDYFALAREEGAEILCGGGAHPDFEQGWFVQPTVARVGDNALRICQEEVFGPFVTIQVFDEPEEAIAIANDSDYGLVAYAWTADLALTLELQRRIEAGTLWVNTPLARDLRAPFGGFKQSGIGRDGPRQSAEFYTEEKATILPRRPATIVQLGAEDESAD